MRTSNKIFFLIAIFTASILTFNFVNNELNLHPGGVLGESEFEDNLDFDLEDFDAFLDTELNNDLEEINLDDIDSTNNNVSNTDGLNDIVDLEDELEAEIEEVEIQFEAATSPTTTRTTSKIQKLFLLIPVEIKTTQVITKSGKVVEEKQTVLGELLDYFSF